MRNPLRKNGPTLLIENHLYFGIKIETKIKIDIQFRIIAGGNNKDQDPGPEGMLKDSLDTVTDMPMDKPRYSSNRAEISKCIILIYKCVIIGYHREIKWRQNFKKISE